MSRLTAAPFSKPSLRDLVASQLPPSPPETDHPDHVPPRADRPSLRPLPPDSHLPSLLPGTESPTTRFRRVSTLAYNQSNLRDIRPSTRNPRWLVVVLPPSTLVREPALLGHTLSVSPPGRFSNGILMPLFPTLYGQLTAVAREFNMPSTAGVCLYLHLTQASLLSTPRISDDAWPFLWAHLFDETAPPQISLTPPVVGTLEFDIDPRGARWLDMWLGAPRQRDSLSHLRHTSQHTLGGHTETDAQGFETLSLPQVLPPQPARRVPRPLSLVDRFGEPDDITRLPSLLDGRKAREFDQQISSQNARLVLSPVPQVDEPTTAKERDLMFRVNNWRDVTSSSPARDPLVGTGQISLDPINMPNSVPQSPLLVGQALSTISVETLEGPINNAERVNELDLNDFSWSISSLGPLSAADNIYSWPSPLPSVDLAGRIEGSVLLTPSVATSFWLDDDLKADDYASLVYRVPSPDLGLRALSDAPPSPSTATSWGPASWSDSPIASDCGNVSIDIALRSQFSRPVTPSTSTSWGPSSVYLVGGIPSPSVVTPDIRERTFSSDNASPPPSLSFPYYDAWIMPPWRSVWPYLDYAISSTSERSHLVPEISNQSGGFTWPYNESRGSSVSSTMDAVWGFNLARGAGGIRSNFHVAENNSDEMNPNSHFGDLESYSTVYSTLRGYPDPADHLGNNTLSWSYPHIVIYPPHFVPSARLSEQIELPFHPSPLLPCNYPFLDIYPATYPNLIIYREVAAPLSPFIENKFLASQASYINIESMMEAGEKSGYPYFDIYPCHYISSKQQPPALTHPSREVTPNYPIFDIYPAVFPYFDIYPLKPNVVIDASLACAHNSEGKNPSKLWQPSAQVSKSEKLHGLFAVNYSILGTLSIMNNYPVIQPYPPVYPFLEPYPGDAARNREENLPVLMSISDYPIIQPYPSAYTILETYSDHDLDANRDLLELTTTVVKYPIIQPYPSVYPFLEPYPGHDLDTNRNSLQFTTVVAKYPIIQPYPSVYPFLEPYPDHDLDANRGSLEFTTTVVKYPIIQPYPLVYPYIELYPESPGNPTSGYDSPLQIDDLLTPSDQTSLVYAGSKDHLIAVPAKSIYPYFEVYPIVQSVLISKASVHVRLNLSYPFMQIYEPAYPSVEPYPSMEPTAMEPTAIVSPLMENHRCDGVNIRLDNHYPSIQLYESVYPFVLPYPSSLLATALDDLIEGDKFQHPLADGSLVHPFAELLHFDDLSVRLKSVYPNIALYDPVYPFVEPYPCNLGFDNTIFTEKQTSHGFGYPYFALYPPVYPHIFPYPSLSTLQHTNPDDSLHVDTVPVKRLRRTHKDLHDFVLGHNMLWKIRRSHLELHQEVVASTVSRPRVVSPSLIAALALPLENSSSSTSGHAFGEIVGGNKTFGIGLQERGSTDSSGSGSSAGSTTAVPRYMADTKSSANARRRSVYDTSHGGVHKPSEEPSGVRRAVSVSKDIAERVKALAVYQAVEPSQLPPVVRRVSKLDRSKFSAHQS